MATFSSEANAQGLLTTLSALSLEGKQLPVTRSDTTNEGKTYYRIRVGPFADRALAQRAVQLVQQRVNITGTLVLLGKQP
ncbi:MAG: SPOR domain-containing protein [Magnetococcus sp. XQGC-1]